jgi:hypothetical protein
VQGIFNVSDNASDVDGSMLLNMVEKQAREVHSQCLRAGRYHMPVNSRWYRRRSAREPARLLSMRMVSRENAMR